MTSNKDILVGYIYTLSEDKCKEIYDELIINDDNYTMVFNNVMLTNSQYNRLKFKYGEEKLKWCIYYLNDWFIKKNVSNHLISYSCLDGWVGSVYDKTYPDKQHITEEYLSEFDRARAYIKSVRPEIRVYDSDVRYYVQRFGIRVMEGIDNGNKFKEALQRYYAVHGRRFRTPKDTQQDG